MRDSSMARLHPAVCLGYFLIVTIITVTVLHPAFAGISLLFGLSLGLRLKGRRIFPLFFGAAVPVMLLTALLNPAFNHRGATILTYLPGGNPLTLESLAFGLAAAVMLGAVLLWFSCLNSALPANRLTCIFGGRAPSTALLLSMTLRFVPRFASGFRQVLLSQRGLTGSRPKGLAGRLRLAASALSAMVTWALENSVETVDSMKSRGYGLGKPTAFSPVRFTPRDGCFLFFSLAFGAICVISILFGDFKFEFYPVLKFGGRDARLAVGAFFALCSEPLILELWEAISWKQSECRI